MHQWHLGVIKGIKSMILCLLWQYRFCHCLADLYIALIPYEETHMMSKHDWKLSVKSTSSFMTSALDLALLIYPRSNMELF